MPARICIPLCAKTFTELLERLDSAQQAGDLVELRLDCLDTNELSVDNLTDLQRSLGSNLIITYRDTAQGGCSQLTRQDRISFWSEQLKQTSDALIDIEADLAVELGSKGILNQWWRVICSHHNFVGMPADLDGIYAQMAQTNSKVIKIAITANDVIDCLPVFKLMERARSEGRDIIAIAMGAAGVATRILGPSRGAFLTYSAIEDQHGTAPGQLTADTLRSIYRFDQIDSATSIFGLVGCPAMHSVSPHMHNAAFDSLGINGVYLPFEVNDVTQFFKRMVHPATREIEWTAGGFSITAPHKQSVMPCLDWIDDDAQAIGSVNTVVVEDERLLGYNTDADGFLEPLQRKLRDLRKLKVAVIGSGGAANAVVWALHGEQADVTLFARNQAKATELADRFNVATAQLPASFRGFDVVVNTTPLGTLGPAENETPATAEQLRGARLVYDLVYNPTETLLLREAQAAGCEVLGGLQMLVGQAAMQFKLWTDREAPVEVMNHAALKALMM